MFTLVPRWMVDRVYMILGQAAWSCSFWVSVRGEVVTVDFSKLITPPDSRAQSVVMLYWAMRCARLVDKAKRSSTKLIEFNL